MCSVTMRWLTPAALARWQQGRVDDLESVVQVNPDKLSAAMAILRRWASERVTAQRQACGPDP